jgi:hypothetical protein
LREAPLVLEDLELVSLLEKVGRPVQVGSVALGLMVARDIDITTLCPKLEITVIFDVGRALAEHPHVRTLLFRNDTGSWNIDSDYPDGIQWRVGYRTSVGGNWTLDLWFIHEQSRQFDLYHLESLAPRLTEETRVAILGIKHAWHGHRTTAATRSTPPSSTTAFVRRPSSAPT